MKRDPTFKESQLFLKPQFQNGVWPPSWPYMGIQMIHGFIKLKLIFWYLIFLHHTWTLQKPMYKSYPPNNNSNNNHWTHSMICRHSAAGKNIGWLISLYDFRMGCDPPPKSLFHENLQQQQEEEKNGPLLDLTATAAGKNDFPPFRSPPSPAPTSLATFTSRPRTGFTPSC